MPHVVTQSCCADASCVFACPVNCIHPTPDEPDFATAEMLYIDPASCVDCGACVRACPVGAIVPHPKLADAQMPFLDINAAFHDPPAPRRLQAAVPTIVRLNPPRRRLDVAIVGSGPAALYAADELLKQAGVEVTVFERLDRPHGLVRHGVAPDHPETRKIQELFARIEAQEGFSYRFGVEVGRDITVDDLAGQYDAVIHASGASSDRRLDIEGEDLPGSSTATDFVAWYNGHPDHTGDTFALESERAVIVGNGNVALDVGRMLATDPERLASTDIAPHALEALRSSAVREVVILARRGPAQAAFTLPEIVGLAARDDIELVVDAPDGLEDDGIDDLTVRQKLAVLRDVDRRAPRPGCRRIVLRFQASPDELVGDERVEGVRVRPTVLVADESGRIGAVPDPDRSEVIESSFVLRSVGYRGTPTPGVPFDEARGVIPNREGRVVTEPGGDVVPGSYVVGWIKRGPTGFIGTNKSCSLETVNHVLTDANEGALLSA